MLLKWMNSPELQIGKDFANVLFKLNDKYVPPLPDSVIEMIRTFKGHWNLISLISTLTYSFYKWINTDRSKKKEAMSWMEMGQLVVPSILEVMKPALIRWASKYCGHLATLIVDLAVYCLARVLQGLMSLVG